MMYGTYTIQFNSQQRLNKPITFSAMQDVRLRRDYQQHNFLDSSSGTCLVSELYAKLFWTAVPNICIVRGIVLTWCKVVELLCRFCSLSRTSDETANLECHKRKKKEKGEALSIWHLVFPVDSIRLSLMCFRGTKEWAKLASLIKSDHRRWFWAIEKHFKATLGWQRISDHKPYIANVCMYIL